MLDLKAYSFFHNLSLSLKVYLVFQTLIQVGLSELNVTLFKLAYCTGCSRIYDPILKLYKQQTGKDSTKAIIFSERS